MTEKAVYGHSETKSLLPSPAYRRQALQKGGIPLFKKEGLGEILRKICLWIP
jgi:hypothetical protein